jgi:hypothetical protein
MRRGTVMTLAGDGMPVVKCAGVDLTRKPRSDGDADEQEGYCLTHLVGDT